MGRYDSLINNLATQNADLHSKDEYLFTIYIPFNFQNREETKVRIKSALLENLRNHEYLKEEGRYHDILVGTVNYYLDQIPIEGKGVVFFLKSNVSKTLRGKEKSIPVEDITITPIYVEFEESIYIGKIFNLDQLVWINMKDRESVVILLDMNESKLYKYIDDELEEIDSISKREWYFTKPKHFSKLNPTRQDSVSYGSSFDKFDRFDRKTLEKFVDRILEKIGKELENGSKDILIYYSNEFGQYIDEIQEYIRGKFNCESRSVKKNIKGKEEILKDMFEVLEKDSREGRYDLLERARGLDKLYVEDWKEVVEASRDGRIDTLFVQFNTQRDGFILDENLVYLEKVDNSIPVDNIYPWLIRYVVSTGGNIVLFYNLKEKELPLISALLRF